MADYPDDDFVVVHPGELTEREKPLVAKYLKDNAALAERGPVDGADLAAGKLAGAPGVGPSLPVTREMVQYVNGKYDPDNKVHGDPETAARYGYRDIRPFGTFGAHDDTFMIPYPFDAHDMLCVSQLNHEVSFLADVYPGDTLTLVSDSRVIRDRTPAEGSTYRSVSIESHGSVWNQKGEKVNDVVFRVMESVRQFKEGRAPENMSFQDSWDAPAWHDRPAHTYTDADWDWIKKVWRNERPREDQVLNWEDVSVGDRPNPTLDGPFDQTVMPTEPYGMGTGGSRTLKREILDPETFATMVRGDDGIWRLPDRKAHIPEVPDGAVSPMAAAFADDDEGGVDTRDIHKEGPDRSVLINFLARDVAIRHVNNWMGYAGRLLWIGWEIMSPVAHAQHGKDVPVEPRHARYLQRVPDMAGKDMTTHGLSQDVAHVQSYVYDTYVQDGEHIAELAWWVQDIEGNIWADGAARVALPSAGGTGNDEQNHETKEAQA